MKNLKHIWSILCANSSVDQKTNNISIFNVLDQLNIEKKVLDLIKSSKKNVIADVNFNLISLWVNEVKEAIKVEQKIEVLDPNGKILGSLSKMLEIPKEQSRTRVINEFKGLPITTTGDYLFKVFLKDEKSNKFIEQAVLPLTIKEV